MNSGLSDRRYVGGLFSDELEKEIPIYKFDFPVLGQNGVLKFYDQRQRLLVSFESFNGNGEKEREKFVKKRNLRCFLLYHHEINMQLGQKVKILNVEHLESLQTLIVTAVYGNQEIKLFASGVSLQRHLTQLNLVPMEKLPKQKVVRLHSY